MNGLSRTALVGDNEPLVGLLWEKREQLLAEGSALSEQGEMKKADGKLKYVKTIEKACDSLCDHRTPISTRQEAKKLKNVGKWIISILEPFFEERNRSQTQLPASQEPLGTNMAGTNGRRERKYIPKKNSAGYALLITLLSAYRSGKEFMKRQELIDEADKTGLSSKPIRPNATGWTGGQPNGKDFYSGWSSMTTLIHNFLVIKSSNPAKYKLTDEGKLVAQQCMDRTGLGQGNCSGGEIAREEEQRASPARQEIGDSSNGGRESASSDEDVQEISRPDLTSPDKRRRRNNSHFSGSQSGMEVDNLTSAQSKRIFLGNSSLQAPPTARAETAARADNLDLSRNNYGHYPASTSRAQGNVTVEIGSVDPDFELAVPPLEAGEKFSDAYDIICILDQREKFRRQTGQVHSILDKFGESLMTQFKVKVETRTLPVGDALWIARHKQQSKEYVLEFVVERKNVDDLWSSIKDNRYKQQKLRMMNCGLKCLLYLVEGDVNTVESTDSLKTAMFTTELQGGFRLLKTEDSHETCKQYGHLTKAIISRYNIETGKAGKSGQVCKTYEAFVEHCKDFQKDRVKDVFCRQLTQREKTAQLTSEYWSCENLCQEYLELYSGSDVLAVISQVTEDIAHSIQDRYPTLFSIAKAFEELEGNQGAQEKLLQGLPIRNTSKSISAVMSKNIYKAIWAP